MSAVATNPQSSSPLQEGVKKNYLTALKEALFEEMQSNPDMVCQGEDIGLLGGAFGVTEGLLGQYGSDRVVDMPISEACIVGSAVGLALAGKTVMAEMQFIDFISCGFDQIVNMMATYHYRTAGEVNLPIVVRGPAGAYSGGALYHSQMNEAWFCNAPGLRVVVPSTPYDAKGLLKAALRDGNPCIFYEIKELYRKREIAEVLPDEDYIVPLGQAKLRRVGSDVTLVSYGQNVYHCLAAAEELLKLGVSAEVIDLRSLVPLDEQTIFTSLAKTHRLVVVNEAPMTCGFAGEVIARVSEKAFDLLDAPPARVTRLDTPVPWAKPLELYVLPSVEKIVAEALRVVKF
ncbi:alpha-ketoacid dehydrogenase subunit beta [Fimbriimonas ginsengisoli]|uniref:Putative 2-oxoisovalerate dehydrogenase subunit beta n=1 Tax=Fimbriimonas ginsengisoli Gsoil 348 TaxID=661478 RepID=A0A068NWX0_FIMGI|nr:alpha-ketoacid dehydrogenase subunit beta [Fimbriimonas ginsengisoli]AIE87867.1 putative 2-oxoisovalerate dehydrogenase subunit beta [Fimbriimonas ginsengisoli Gsoil 348]